MILSLLDKVHTFQNVFGQIQSQKLSFLLKKDRKLRFDLQLEEYLEFQKAERERNNVEILDALIDGIYICCGSILAHGFKNVDSYFNAKNVTEKDIFLLLNIGKTEYIDGHLATREILQYFTNLLFWHIEKIKEFERKGIFVKDCLYPAFLEVHNSNMSKLENGKPIFREDGKVLKGKNFQTPDLKKFICLD